MGRSSSSRPGCWRKRSASACASRGGAWPAFLTIPNRKRYAMHARQAAAMLIAVAVSTTLVLADVKGGPNPPTFTPEETALIKRDPRLVAAAKDHPWHLRCALDACDDIRPARPGKPQPCPQLPPEPGRASTEGPFDLLQILKEAAGGSGGTKR